MLKIRLLASSITSAMSKIRVGLFPSGLIDPTGSRHLSLPAGDERSDYRRLRY